MKGLASWTISLFCLLAILIKGHHGFFIKHSGTGLCIKPTNIHFESGYWGKQYYVEFYDNCLHSDAQFRYVDKEFVVNIGKDGTLIARVKKRYKYRFLVYHPGSQSTKVFLRGANHTLKQTASGSLVTYQGKWCAIPKTLKTPGKGDELIRKNTCGTELQKFTFGSVTNDGATMTDVNCASSQKMEVVMAEYGVFSNGKTFDKDNDIDCSLPAACIVKNQCNNKSSCAITVDSSLFPFNQCAGTKQLHMEYQCVDKLDTPITSVSDVRLSKEVLLNEGFIEVFNGKIWRKLSDESWDKRKQAALCRHLGYSDGENDTVVKNITSVEVILSGDLYCQGTKPSSQSCCAYLYPSTSTGASNMAYAKCKICDDPLLQNSTRFPDEIFSANDGNGYEIRLSNNGWCSTTSVSSYLQIDLKRDFYISYIVTFGDNARTKWLKSYVLKYSNTVDLDSKTGKTITANHDAYRASITKLDIFYASYLKIIPKSGNDFCLRVELCGQVLLPDPVSNVVVSKATKTANVSWSLPQIQGHGGVTYFLIFLNGTKKGNLTRDKIQYTLNDLKPYRNYEVAIKAGNVYGVGESYSKTFRTHEAVPGGAPLNVAVVSQNSTTLRVSWQPPKQDLLNGIITRYNICYSTTGDKEKCFEVKSVTSYDIKNLQPAVEYFVKVSAGTKVGYGVFSENINKITNQDPVVPSRKTYYSLNINVEKPRNRIQWILVIVQAASIHEKITDQYSSNELKPFNKGQVFPYVTAGLNASGLSQTFVIGDGMWYNLSKASYFNQPLKEDTDYTVFLRFIKSKVNYNLL